MATSGFNGIVTGSPALALPLRGTPGLSVARGDVGEYLSVSGHCTNVEKNNHKGYGMQVVVDSAGKEVYYAWYGRIGERCTAAPTEEGANARQKFYDVLRSKFGFERSVKLSSIIANQLQGTVRMKDLYAVDHYDIFAPAAPAAPAIGAAATAALAPLRQRAPVLLPEVAALLARILSQQEILHSMRGQMDTLGVVIGGDTYPTQRAISAAQAACAAGRARIRQLPPAVRFGDIQLTMAFQGVLENIPLRIGNSARQNAREAMLSEENWQRIAEALDLLEQAAASARKAAVPEGAPAPAEPAQAGPESGPEAWEGMLYEGIFRSTPAAGRCPGVGRRPNGESAGIKRAVAEGSGDRAAALYANLGADIVPGNESDRAICARFVQQSRRAKGFDCYSIHLWSSERKAPHHAGKEALLLVHGTGLSSIAAILGSELDIKYCSGGRLGPKRLYMADHIEKSEQYAGLSGGTRYFFICQCALPKDVLRTANDLDWNAPVDPAVLVHALSSNSRGALDPAAPKLRDVVGDAPPDCCGRTGYFGDNTLAVRLPKEHPEGGNDTDFRHAEYAFGQNDDIVPRYLIAVRY